MDPQKAHQSQQSEQTQQTEQAQLFRTTRDINYINDALYDDTNPVKHITAIKSCIEADEARYLLEVLNNNHKAKIYSLIMCFTFIPSVRCIKYLIAEGTPLNETFENNPFQCTPQEYLNMRFPASNRGRQQLSHYAICAIYEAIEKGKLIMKNNTHVNVALSKKLADVFFR